MKRTVPTPAVEDVRIEVGSQTVMNWTTLELEARVSSSPRGAQDLQAVEQTARRLADAQLKSAVLQVPVADGLTVGQLLEDDSLSAPVRSRVNRWLVRRAEYLSSGSVQLLAVLSIQDVAKPWTLKQARKQAPPVEAPRRYTGLIVDARQIGVTPVLTPSVVSATGEVLVDGWLWEEEAVDHSPVVYVPDPAHPASARAGEQPLIVMATGFRGGKFSLSASDSERLAAGLKGARLLGEGKVVVVVDR